jgi:hypothetical protein
MSRNTSSNNYSPEPSAELLDAPRQQDPGLFIQNERGGVAVALATTLSVLGLVGIAVAGPAGSWIGTRVTQEVDAKESKVVAEHLATKAVNFSCRTHDFFDASGSVIDLSMHVRGYTIPESWTRYKFENGSIAVLETCQDESKPSAVTSTEEDVITTESGESFYMNVVEINRDNIVSKIQFPANNLKITKTEGTGMTGIKVASGGGKLALTAACLPVKAGVAAAGNSIDCTEFAGFATKFVNAMDTSGQITAQEQVLKAIQQEGGAAIWETQTLPAFIDSIACEVVQENGEEALEALRIKMTGKNTTPDFSKDMYADYAGSLLAKPDETNTEALPKVTIKALNEPYDPKCYSKAVADPETPGLFKLVGK